MLYVFVFDFNIIVYSQFIQSDIIQVCCSIKNINSEYIIFLPDLIIFASRAVDIPTGDTHIPSDMSIGIHKPQGYPYHCDTDILKIVNNEPAMLLFNKTLRYAIKTNLCMSVSFSPTCLILPRITLYSGNYSIYLREYSNIE